MSTLYIGNLDPQVTESLIYELFIQISPVQKVYLPKDRILRTHQGYGFVELKNSKDCEYAEKIMSGISLYGKSLKINKINQKEENMDIGPSLYIKNLSELVDEEMLSSVFSKVAPLFKPAKINRDDLGKSKTTGVVYYKNFKDADMAIKKMNNQYILNQQVTVEYAYKQGKQRHGGETERLLDRISTEGISRISTEGRYS